MVKYQMMQDCGCCYAELEFASNETAATAVNKVALMNGAVITDDAGIVHEGLDTFYGIWLSQVE